MNWKNKIDWEPVLWFCLSAVFVFIGYILFVLVFESPKDNQIAAGFATLFSALGGAGIARVRSSRQNIPTGQPDQEPIFRNRS